jgi:hypothetical protein
METKCQGTYQRDSYGEGKRNVNMPLSLVQYDHEIIIIGLDGLPANWKN